MRVFIDRYILFEKTSIPSSQNSDVTVWTDNKSYNMPTVPEKITKVQIHNYDFIEVVKSVIDEHPEDKEKFEKIVWILPSK